MTVDEYNFGLNVIQIVIGIVAGIGGFWLLSPAKRKLVKLEQSLENQNKQIDLIRKSVVDSNVRNIEARYNRSCEACFSIYEAFHKIHMASAPIMNFCKNMKDLRTIKAAGKNPSELHRLAEYLKTLIPPDWEKDKVFSPVVTAELIVPARIFQLYSEAKLLFWLLHAQILNLEAGSPEAEFDWEKINKRIETLFPAMGDSFRTHGTSYYSTVMDAIKTELYTEIRKHLDLAPVTVDEVSRFVTEPTGLIEPPCKIPKEFKSFAQSLDSKSSDRKAVSI
jgi:hypothetical protein